MSWLERLNSDPTPWLLENDPNNPGLHYFALRELMERPCHSPEVIAARGAIMNAGPVPVILDAQASEGYWAEPGPSYNPKYRATVWQVSLLAQLGANGLDPRLRAGCEYVLEHARSKHGGFSMTATPAGMIHCLQGNLCAALIGYESV